jgi:hypothetical protein
MMPLIKHLLGALPILVVVACDKPMSPALQKAADDRAVKQVEATNRALPPLRPVTPQPLLHSFIERNAAGARVCAFVPRGEAAAIALTLGDRTELRIDGQPAVFSADKGSAKLPTGTWSRYLGKALVLGLEQPGAQSPLARLVISDPYNRSVYLAWGSLRCPPI